MKRIIIPAFAALMLCGGSTVVSADTPAYQAILGSWDGTWHSTKSGATGKVTFSCRRGSSLSPNCTAKIYNAKTGQPRIFDYAPDWKGNGKLEWKNGPLRYVFQLQQDGTLRVNYTVRKDKGYWLFRRK